MNAPVFNIDHAERDIRLAIRAYHRVEADIDNILKILRENAQNSRALEELNALYGKLLPAKTRAVNLLETLSDYYMDGDGASPALQAEVENRKSTFVSLFDTLQVTILQALATQAVQPQAWDSTICVVEVLKPQLLTRKHSPAEFRAWKEMWEAYYLASGFAAAPIIVQRAYIRGCVEDKLWSHIAHSLDANMPLSGVMSALEAEFWKMYPLFNRRLDFFRYPHDPAVPLSEYIISCMEMAREALLYELTPDDMLVFIICSSVQHDEFLQEVYKAYVPGRTTVKDLMEIARRVETISNKAKGRKAAAAADAGNPAIAALADKILAAVKTSGTSNKSDKKVIVPKTTRRALRGKCMRCGASAAAHMADDCPKKSETCFNCGKIGHLATVCMGGRRQKSKVSGATSQELPGASLPFLY